MRKKDSLLTPSDRIATRRDVEEIVTKIIDNFAIMVKRGFDECAKKQDIDEFRNEMYEFKANIEPAVYTLQADMVDVKSILTKVEIRLTHVEDSVISLTTSARNNWHDHETRIVRLEERLT
jgi:hypothetical protein